MARHIIGLSVIEDPRSTDLPEEVQRIGAEAVQAIWQICARMIAEESSKIKVVCERREQDAQAKQKTALESIDRLTKEIAQLKGVIDTHEREKKALASNLERKTGETQVMQTQLRNVEERNAAQEHEIKRFSEELGRSRENADSLQKRLDETTRQMKQDQLALRGAQEENVVHVRTRERLEEQLRELRDEQDKLRERQRTEHARAAVAEALTEEMKVTLGKQDTEIKNLKAELQARRENLESETKQRVDAERKLTMISTHTEAQDRVHREAIIKLEQEVSASKAELLTLRTRVIKSEGALEREKKAVERLETRLAVLAGGKATGGG